MSRKYKINDQSKIYFLSFATINWIDAFTRKLYKDIFVESLNHCIAKKGLEIYGWCLMTNHTHLIAGTKGNIKLEDIIRDYKKFTSKMVTKCIKENIQESRKEWMLWMFARAGKKNPNNEKYQFWQQNNQPIELWNEDLFLQKLNYIHMNPVVEGIVDDPGDYVYSSARDYNGKMGLVEVIVI